MISKVLNIYLGIFEKKPQFLLVLNTRDSIIFIRNCAELEIQFS